jgi:membrane protein YdbS with pleckstrin-like domain
MPQRIYTFGKSSHPILQVLYFIIGTVLLIGALLVGAVILSIAIGVAAVVGLIVFIRVWWLNRKIERGDYRRRSGNDTIEVEYTVLRERDDDDRRG